jgi:hypothetical protein
VVARRATSRKTTKTSRTRPEDALFRRLEDALSEDEIRRVLVCALEGLSGAARDDLLARIGPETAAALRSVLSPPLEGARSPGPKAPAASKAKLRQEWGRLWEQWEAVIASANDDEGKYILQDAPWEAPYIDTDSVSRDLDAIAGRMRPLIPSVIAAGVAPDFSFADAVRALDDDLFAGLPDWLDPARDGFMLGPAVTSCLFEWEWTVAQRDGRDVPAFLDEIRDLEIELQAVELDDQALQKLVLGLSNEDLRASLESMSRQRQSARWRDAFAEAYGAWPTILRRLSRRWDPRLFTETSRANIAQSWPLALPLIQDALKRKAYAEAAALVDEALRSLLRSEKKPPWDPRRELLVHQRAVSLTSDKDVAKLLQLWQKTSEAQGKLDMAAALGVQIVALSHLDEGDTMLDALRALTPSFGEVREALFASFRRWVVGQTLETFESDARVPCGDWVGALVDAARAGRDGARAFEAAVRATLKEACALPAPRPAEHLGRVFIPRAGPLLSLAVLTCDLDAAAPGLGRAAPKLARLLSSEVDRERARLAATRRAWAKRLGAPSLLAEVLAFWRDAAVRFVPDPGAPSSSYDASADWLAAVHELNPAAAEAVLARWAEAHRLKRNLWREVAARGLSPPAGVRSSPPTRRGTGRRGG